MKRDNDYLRELLFKIEGDENCLTFGPTAYGQSEAQEKEHYHLQLLCDAGHLVQIGDITYRLTNQGHDFIESIRDKGIWEKTKEAVAESGGNATLEMIKAIATGFLKKKLSEHANIDL